MFKGSWKTTLAGVGTVLTALGTAVTALVNGTDPNWPAIITAVISGLGLIFARDNGVTSEKAGVK